MEHMTKRKKRKTRKCLNKLRKNLNANLSNGDSLCVNSSYNVNMKQNCINKSNCIAGNDRLTLGLFHNSVRSETITRSALSEIKLESVTNVNKIINNSNLIRENNRCQLHCLSCNSENSSHSCSINILNSKKHKMQETCYISSNKNILINRNENLSSKPVVYSPIKLQVTVTPMLEQSENLSITASSIERSQSEESVSQLYEEFIDNMPKYLREKTPILIYHDIMNQTKDYLYNLYVDSYHCETENNLIQCIQKNSHGNESVIADTSIFLHRNVEEDPMNYLKVRYIQEQSDPHETVESTSVSSPSSTLTALNISYTSQSSVHDTPEYIYFPHKLNQ